MANSRTKYHNVTVRGINLKVPKDALDDIELVELLADLQEGNVFAFPKAARIVFGDQYKEVMTDLAGKDGKTKASDAAKFFTEVMTAISAIQAKN